MLTNPDMASPPLTDIPSQPISALEPPPIRRLETAVVNRIAAGEVIQRPASALKELLENSLDAGATTISVTIKDGGLKLIQICDNGHGVRYEDLPLLCERHATSKLLNYEDLESISTLGFRGEALASMTFVAHLSVITMTAGKSHGFKVSYKEGVMEGEPRPCAAVKGTQILVENLFYNFLARRKAFKSPSEEYGRIMDIISRYAIHKLDVSFSCKKHGDTKADVHTTSCSSRLDAVRSIYGAGVARELIAISIPDESPSGSPFQVEGFISSANYSAKKTNMVLFINDRLVECNSLRKAIEVVYASILPKASKPFLYFSITMPGAHVDVNVHPTKREVTFLDQDKVVNSIQKAVETKLLESNTTRTFYTQTLLPGVGPIGDDTPAPRKEERGARSLTPAGGPPLKAPVYKLVRTDALNPAGRLHAFLQKKSSTSAEDKNDLDSTRRLIRQRRNPKEGADLTSIQELLVVVDQDTHSGLMEILKKCSYVGMADAVMALVQYNTGLYALNVVNLSKELIYQQVLRRFGQFDVVQLSTPVSLYDLFLMALNTEDSKGRWHASDGPKEEIAKLNAELLICKAEMLLEYFSVDIDKEGNLYALPIVLDQYSPDMDRLPDFVLNIANNVDWETEKECFETFAAALGDFYAIYPPLLPDPSEEGVQLYHVSQQIANDGVSIGGTSSKNFSEHEELVAEAKTMWAHREWTIQHVLFPAMKLFLSPPHHLANDGTAIRIAHLENLYKVFERC